jgi:hypothetical protein
LFIFVCFVAAARFAECGGCSLLTFWLEGRDRLCLWVGIFGVKKQMGWVQEVEFFV